MRGSYALCGMILLGCSAAASARVVVTKPQASARAKEPDKRREAPAPMSIREIADDCAMSYEPVEAPDVREQRCREQSRQCAQDMAALRTIAEDESNPDRARALEVAARAHREHACSTGADACNLLGEHDEPGILCPELGWVHEVLAQAARADDGEMRLAAALQLQQTPGPVEVVVPALRGLLARTRPEALRSDGSMTLEQQAAAAAALAVTLYGQSAAAVVPELTIVVQERREYFAQEELVIDALFALQGMGEAALPAKTALVDALEDRRPRVCSMAANTLAGLGEAARDAVPALNRLANDPRQSSDVRDTARMAVIRLSVSRLPADPFAPLDARF
jgi:hypothetical protein